VVEWLPVAVLLCEHTSREGSPSGLPSMRLQFPRRSRSSKASLPTLFMSIRRISCFTKRFPDGFDPEDFQHKERD
jgi:hypothetical protein